MAGGGGGGGMNWEIGIDICTLIFIKWVTNKNLLHKKILKFQKKKKNVPLGNQIVEEGKHLFIKAFYLINEKEMMDLQLPMSEWI